MPELPEVETTVNGLKRVLVGLTIKDVWTDLDSKDTRQSDAVKNKKYFPVFRKNVIGKKVLSVERVAKNILINLSGNKTVLIHMKMTGHLLYGKYKFDKAKNKWEPDEKGPLQDPYNRFIHVVFTLSNGKHLAFCDSRKFGKVALLDTDTAHDSKHLKGIGPDPLDKKFEFENFKERLLKKPSGKIKSVLMDQTIIAGIGNIYSDEMLWTAGIHPLSKPGKVPEEKLKLLFKAMRDVLAKGIDFGGDSMSDYRNIYGESGDFQNHHNVYRKKGEYCRFRSRGNSRDSKKGCSGVIMRLVVGGRSAHFCPVHQIKN